MDSEDEDGSILSPMNGLYEPYRHGQLIIIDKDLLKFLCNLLIEPPFFLCTLTNHPWIIKDGNVNLCRAMTSNKNQEDNLRT